MPAPTELLTAAKIAAQLKVSDAKVKKAIAALGLAPAAKKGVCNYYEKSAVPKIKKALG
jgi:precorrin isomerase